MKRIRFGGFLLYCMLGTVGVRASIPTTATPEPSHSLPFDLGEVEKAQSRCAVCGMPIAAHSKLSYIAHEGKHSFILCSFACAHKFKSAKPSYELFARDFMTGQAALAEGLYFLTHSHAIQNEVEFGMEPLVVAFIHKNDAQATQRRLGDGKVVTSYEQLEKLF